MSTSRTTPTSPSTKVSKSSIVDTRRGMPRGANHSMQEAFRDTRREQTAQVGHQKASAITRSTGLRRRERRFESCRGHHALPVRIAQRDRFEQALTRFRGMLRGENSSHEPLHTLDRTAGSGPVDDRGHPDSAAQRAEPDRPQAWIATVRGRGVRSSGAVLRAHSKRPESARAANLTTLCARDDERRPRSRPAASSTAAGPPRRPKRTSSLPSRSAASSPCPVGRPQPSRHEPGRDRREPCMPRPRLTGCRGQER
jgi:hypothetical protein